MKKILLSLALVFGLTSFVQADIFQPVDPAKSTKLEATAPTVFDSGTVLTDAAAIINYLGVREGEAYNFGNHSWVTTTGATLITYDPWNLAIGITMLNADGVAGDIDWNVGNYIPVQNVPVIKYFQYLYVIAGCGGELDNNNNWKIAPILGAEFKFSF